MKINPNTCLIIIDMQNDFLDLKGYYAQKRDITPMIKTKNNVKLVMRKAFNKIPIIFVQAEYKPEQFGKRKYLCTKGSWGQRIVFDKKYADIIIKKEVYSAFSNINLTKFLEQKNIKDILISGVTTENCVRETSLDALEKGFKVIILKDCVGTNKELEENQKKVFEELKNKGAIIIGTKQLSF